MKPSAPTYVSTTNACKLCTPLGACLAFRGIEGAVPLLHGSQGCATYMRRYIISHFREPVDIASSALGEKHAVYGGEANLRQGLRNILEKFEPTLIGVATTCLTETIGDDVPRMLRDFRRELEGTEGRQPGPRIVHVATPSYSGTHMEGFHGAVRAVVDALAECGEATGAVNVLPGFVSPADTRYLMELMEDFGIAAAFLPDLSETLDGPALEDYRKVPAGGTPTECIRCMGGAPATLELGRTLFGTDSAGRLLEQRFAVPLRGLGLPVGLRETDHLVETLEELAGIPLPRRHAMERGRLLDAYVDGHKYLFGQRVAIFGDPDLVVGLTAFAAEIGLHPVMCASGSRSGRLGEAIRALTHDLVAAPVPVHEGLDFFEIAAIVDQLKPDLLIGSGKGFPIARQHGVPLIRVGFPIHDRFGGQRVLHVGYRGAQALLDRLINAVIARKQDESSVGYSYL